MHEGFHKSGPMGFAARCLARSCGIFRRRSSWIPAVLVSLLLLMSSSVWAAQNGQSRNSAQVQSRPELGSRPGGVYGGQYGSPRMGHPMKRGEHLPQWFRQHQNLSFPAQEHALRNEPGFNWLPPATQERLLNRLRQLNTMPPLQRERTLQRMEAMERLSPAQRQEVRSAMQQVTNMPPDRQRMIHKAFRDLSQMSYQQRWAILNSQQFRGQFSDWERQTLGTILSVQPYAPDPGVGPRSSYGGR
jgi:hypothetical protein